MEDQTTHNKKKTYLISGLVFIVLFVLPLGSIYFLNSGKEYRMESLSEMKDMGSLPSFNLKNQNNLDINPDILRGRVAVVNFLSENDSIAKYQAKRISKIHQSYNNTEDVIFLSFIKKDSNENLINRASGLGISDHQQWYLLAANKNEFNSFPNSVFKINDPEKGIALIDTSMTIRRHYDISNNSEMGRLVEQIAIVIPKQKRRGM